MLDVHTDFHLIFPRRKVTEPTPAVTCSMFIPGWSWLQHCTLQSPCVTDSDHWQLTLPSPHSVSPVSVWWALLGLAESRGAQMTFRPGPGPGLLLVTGSQHCALIGQSTPHTWSETGLVGPEWVFEWFGRWVGEWIGMFDCSEIENQVLCFG